jgi:hypothetical protein
MKLTNSNRYAILVRHGHDPIKTQLPPCDADQAPILVALRNQHPDTIIVIVDAHGSEIAFWDPKGIITEPKPTRDELLGAQKVVGLTIQQLQAEQQKLQWWRRHIKVGYSIGEKFLIAYLHDIQDALNDYSKP